MSKAFHVKRFVEFSDTDMAGIAHFSKFFHYMESAEHALLRAIGMSVFYKLEDGRTLSFPRVSAHCDYESPVWCEDELDVHVTVKRIGGKSLTYGFKFSRDNKPIAEGRMTCVCCLIEEGKPPESTKVPEELAAKLQPYLETGTA